MRNITKYVKIVEDTLEENNIDELRKYGSPSTIIYNTIRYTGKCSPKYTNYLTDLIKYGNYIIWDGMIKQYGEQNGVWNKKYNK